MHGSAGAQMASGTTASAGCPATGRPPLTRLGVRRHRGGGKNWLGSEIHLFHLRTCPAAWPPGGRPKPLGVSPTPPPPRPGVPARAPRGARPPGICRRWGRSALPLPQTSRPAALHGTRCPSAACRSPVPPSWKRRGG